MISLLKKFYMLLQRFKSCSLFLISERLVLSLSWWETKETTRTTKQKQKPDEEVTTKIDLFTSQREHKRGLIVLGHVPTWPPLRHVKTLYIDKLTSIDINKQFFLHCVSALAVIILLIFVKSSCFNASLKDSSLKSKLDSGKKTMINIIIDRITFLP